MQEKDREIEALKQRLLGLKSSQASDEVSRILNCC
jgi:hypothetical protein